MQHEESTGTPLKLTKQQKRDSKRNLQKTQPKHGKPTTKKLPVEGSSVYKRNANYPASYNDKNAPTDRFVTPNDACFENLLSTSYRGFEIAKPNEFNSDYSSRFQNALSRLQQLQYYKFDITQPTGLGTKVAKTFVTRCLVGNPGITYKYLGLRMFAYPWIEDTAGSNEALVELGRLNMALIAKTKQLLKSSMQNDNCENGSCDYNLTLINRCLPSDEIKLKGEPLFQQDKISVSWHADSSLEHYSSIAVYSFTIPLETSSSAPASASASGISKDDLCPKTLHNPLSYIQSPIKLKKRKLSNSPAQILNITSCNETQLAWKLALKVSPNAEGPRAQKLKISSTTVVSDAGSSSLSRVKPSFLSPSTLAITTPFVPVAFGTPTVTAPPVAVPLQSEDTYFLLDDFNHHHQHAVLAGSDVRYSSTHRVSREDGHTYRSIHQRCISSLQGSNQDPRQVRSEQLALSEVEFEWIRQFYVQGSAHYHRQVWWHEPMQHLLLFWSRLEQRTANTIQALLDASNEEFASSAGHLQLTGNKKMAKRILRANQVKLETFDEIITALNDRHSKRSGWASRVSDPIHRKLHPNERPMSIPYPAQGLWRLNESRTEVICNPTSNAATIAYSASKMDNDEGVKLQLNDLAKTLSWKAEKKNKKTLYKTRKLFAQVSTNEAVTETIEISQSQLQSRAQDPGSIHSLEHLLEVVELLEVRRVKFMDLQGTSNVTSLSSTATDNVKFADQDVEENDFELVPSIRKNNQESIGINNGIAPFGWSTGGLDGAMSVFSSITKQFKQAVSTTENAKKIRIGNINYTKAKK